MTLADLGAVGELLAAVAVLVTLVYLARQVKQANLLARAQARGRMTEQAQAELYTLLQHPELVDLSEKEALDRTEQARLNFFLSAAMRQRELEWFQYQDGLVDEDVFRAYHSVIAIQLGSERTRRWWARMGRRVFDPGFVAEVDAVLEREPLSDYNSMVTSWDEEVGDDAADDPEATAAGAAPD